MGQLTSNKTSTYGRRWRVAPEVETAKKSSLMRGRERFSQVPGVAWTFLCAECDCLKWFPEECFQKETARWGKAGIAQPLPLRARNTLTLLPRETHPSQPKATLKGARASYRVEIQPNNHIRTFGAVMKWATRVSFGT